MTHRLTLVSSYTTGTDLILTLPNMVRYAIVDVLDSVTADRKARSPHAYSIYLSSSHHAHSLADSQTCHPSPVRPPMPYIQTFVALDLPSAS
jgi:hypothetical protein